MIITACQGADQVIDKLMTGVKRAWSRMRLPGLVNQYQSYLAKHIRSQPYVNAKLLTSTAEPKLRLPSLLGYYQKYFAKLLAADQNTTPKPMSLPDVFMNFCRARFGPAQPHPVTRNIASLCQKKMIETYR